MTCTRLSFLAAIFGFGAAAKAQQWKECEPPPAGHEPTVLEQEVMQAYPTLCYDKHKPALNNQCPVCGTMAVPYMREYVSQSVSCAPVEGSAVLSCTMMKVALNDSQKLARCARCNNAFFQDAEN